MSSNPFAPNGFAGLSSRIGAVVLMTSLAIAALSGGAVADEFPRNLSCSFETGTAGSYESGDFVPSSPQPLSFSIRDIDLDGQIAGLMTDEGKAPGTLRIVRALNANHFIEAVTEGFLNLTTVYEAGTADAQGRLPAVHSRHFGVLGQAVYAQYTGFCTVAPDGAP